MASYGELRDAMRHIADAFGDPNAWQRGLSVQDIADINGYLHAQTDHRPGVVLGHVAGGDTVAVPGWLDPVTHKVYEYRPTSSGDAPQVPDSLIGSLRNHFPGLFGPEGESLTVPPGPLPPAPASGAPPAGAGLPTIEQQSGRTADAVRKLQDELKKRYGQINAAEETLSEALLNAHATTAEGQRRLNDIQAKLVEAVNNPSAALDTPAGETAFLKFLRTQVAAITDVVNSGALTDADAAKTVKALADLYSADTGQTSIPPASSGESDPSGGAEVSAPESVVPPQSISSEDFAGSGAPMPDPPLSDLGLAGLGTPLGVMPDPLSSLASTLPAAMGGFGFPAGAAAPLDGVAGLAGTAGPLAGLAAQLHDQPHHADGGDSGADAKTDKNDSAGDEAARKHDTVKDAKPVQQAQPAGPPQPDPAATVPASGAPPVGAAPPPTTVQLPDGSTANARTPSAAQAVRAYLAGTPLEAAYRQVGIELPPPGTPVAVPIAPSELAAGDVGMFADHYVVALGAAKALKDGQVVPLASVSSSPDFLGWMRPATSPPADPVNAAAAPSG